METDILGNEEGVNTVSDNEYPYKYLVTPISNDMKDNFLISPIKFGIALKGSAFADAIMNVPVINRGRGSVIISTKQTVSCELDKVVLGTWKVNCKPLTDQALSYGVIGPICESEDLIAIKDELVSSGYPVMNIQRLYKRANGQNQSTQCVKIGFKVKELPSKVMIWFIPFKVTLYMPSVRQCFQCQRFGHFAKNCNSKSRCLFCSEEHAFKDCPKTRKKCANCKGEHLANYGGCPNFQNARKIEHMAAEAGVSYSAIIDQMKNNNLTTPVPQRNGLPVTVTSELASSSSESDNRNRSYADILNSTSLNKNKSSNVNCFQTEESNQSTLDKLSKLSDSLQSLLDALNNIVTKILKIATPSMSSPILDVINAFCQILPKETFTETEFPSNQFTKKPELISSQTFIDYNIDPSSGARSKVGNLSKNSVTSTPTSKNSLGGTKRKDKDNNADISDSSKIPKPSKKQK